METTYDFWVKLCTPLTLVCSVLSQKKLLAPEIAANAREIELLRIEVTLYGSSVHPEAGLLQGGEEEWYFGFVFVFVLTLFSGVLKYRLIITVLSLMSVAITSPLAFSHNQHLRGMIFTFLLGAE